MCTFNSNMDTCVNCNEKFVKCKKNFNRRSIDCHTKIPLLSYRDILNDARKEKLTPSSKYICEGCASVCVRVKRSQIAKTSKRPLTPCGTPGAKKRPKFCVATPLKRRSRFSTPKKGTHSSSEWKERVKDLLSSKKYFQALKLLFTKSEASRDALRKIIPSMMSKEVKRPLDVNMSLAASSSLKSVEAFTWARAFPELQRQYPLLMTVLCGSLSTTRKQNRVSVDAHGNIGNLVPVCGFLAGIILHHAKPRTFDFLQSVISLQLYKSGCSQKLFHWFHKLGWCKDVKTTRSTVDRITKDHDRVIKDWKTDLEKDLGGSIHDGAVANNDNSVLSVAAGDNSNLLSLSDFLESDSPDETDDTDFEPYSDSSIATENSSESDIAEIQRDYEDRNPGYSLCWDNVQKMSLTRHHLKKENKMMLWALCFATKNRISFRHLDLKSDTTPISDIPLHQYLPNHVDYELLRDRMENIVQRLVKGILPSYFGDMSVPQIQHQYMNESSMKSEIVNLGVIKENPASTRGTIEILKFLNQYVPMDINEQPYHILVNGDQLSVERMVEAKIAMSYGNDPSHRLTGLIPRPQGFHKRCIILQDSMNMLYHGGNIADPGSLFHIRNKFNFRNVKSKVSDCVNHVVDLFNFAVEGCICLLLCKFLNMSNIDENPGVGIPENTNEKNVFFVDLCRKIVQVAEPKIDMDSIIIGGGEDPLDVTCPYTEDNQVPLVGSTRGSSSQPDPPSHDAIQQYSCALLWRGLLHLVQTDAERHNNGDQLISDWRLDMVEFWNCNHNKYLTLGHRLLAGVNGWLPPRIQQEIIWNSTGNIHGGSGRNVALDLINEFPNNEFKDNLKNCHGQYTEDQVARCSKLLEV